MIPTLSPLFKKPFAEAKDGWPIPEAVIVYGKKKHEIRPVKEELRGDAYRVWSQHRNAYILILDCYLVRLRFEWVGRKWHDA